MTAPTIRTPRAHEAEALASLHLRTWAETYAGQFPPDAWNDEARAARVRLWTAICEAPRPTDSFAVAELDGEVVGFAGVGADLDPAAPRPHQLWFIYLLASAQGQGTGQVLLDEVLGERPASLWVLERNPRAVAFYDRNGFLADGTRHPSGYDAAGDELRMVR
jgi:GNAT superfamily N-acetyltransferase